MIKKKEDQIEIPSFDGILAEFNKRHGKGSIDRMSKLGLNVERLPTGIPIFDELTGGGLPKGRIVDFFGRPSSGKSLISLQAIKQAQLQNKECVYLDCEHALDPEFAKRVGVDIDKLTISRISIGEDVMDLICGLLPSNPGVIVLDSWAAVVTRAELEENSDQKFMAPKARLMTNALKKILELNQDTLIIIINQIRSSMVLYGPPTYSTGGNALEHAASIRVEVAKGEKLTIDGKKTSEVIGQMINFNIKKSKISPADKKGSFKFFYDGRIG